MRISCIEDHRTVHLSFRVEFFCIPHHKPLKIAICFLSTYLADLDKVRICSLILSRQQHNRNLLVSTHKESLETYLDSLHYIVCCKSPRKGCILCGYCRLCSCDLLHLTDELLTLAKAINLRYQISLPFLLLLASKREQMLAMHSFEYSQMIRKRVILGNV